MRIGPNKAMGVLLVCLGLVLGALALVALSSMGERSIGNYGPLISAGACVLAGVALASRPVFELADDRIIVFAMLGPRKWRYPFARLGDVRIVGDRIHIADRALPIRKGRCDPRDWAKFVAALRER